jgi:hypothetical protein
MMLNYVKIGCFLGNDLDSKFGVGEREGAMSDRGRGQDVAILRPLLRAFVTGRREALGLRGGDEKDWGGSSALYRSTLATLSDKRKEPPGRKLLGDMSEVLCRRDRGDDAPFPPLACQLFTLAGRLWVENPIKDHIKSYQPGDQVYVNLPNLGFVPSSAEKSDADEGRPWLPAEELGEMLIKSAASGVTYVFLQKPPDAFDVGQQALIRRAKELADQGERHEGWQDNIHWVIRRNWPASALPPCIVIRRGQNYAGMIPLLARGVGGRTDIFLPYAFAPLDQPALDAYRESLERVRTIIQTGGAESDGFALVPWQ